MPNNLTNTPSTAPRVFNAVNGTELKAIILAEIKRMLDEDSRFATHLTYPVFSFAFHIKLARYPGEPRELEVEGRYRRVTTEDIPTGEPEQLDLKGSLAVDAPAEGGLAPDEARERAGLPVTVPTRVPVGKSGVSTVDAAPATSEKKPTVNIMDDDPAVLAGGHPSANAVKRLENERKGLNADGSPRDKKPAEPKNRPEASPNFARSVDLQTRVNPDGARVDDNIGTRRD